MPDPVDWDKYVQVNTFQPYEILPGDLVYHRKTNKVEVKVTPETDLIQEEAYILLDNFGCELWRKRDG